MDSQFNEMNNAQTNVVNQTVMSDRCVQEQPMSNQYVQPQPMVEQPKQDKKTKKKEKVKITYTKKDKITSVFYILSSLIWIVALLYFFLDVHSDVWTKNGFLRIIPKANKYVVLPIPFYSKWMGGYIGYSGMFALELMTIATFLSALGKWCNRLKVAERMKTCADLFGAALILLHIFVQAVSGFSVFLNIKWYLVMFGVAILAGAILGMLARKMWKLDVVK